MPVLLGISRGELIAAGVEIYSHPQGIQVMLQNRELVRALWAKYYPHWQMGCDNVPLALAGVLKKYKLTFSLAESCSGGGIADRLTDIPGISAVFTGGVVVYTPRAKSRLLGLRQLSPGCVNPTLTLDMARSVKCQLGAAMGLGITGALGPQSPAPHISVGEIYIAVAGLKKEEVRRFNFYGDRQTIKKAAVDAALNFMLTFVARWYVA